MAFDASKLDVVQRFFSGTGFSYDRVVTVCTSGFDPYWKRRILAAIPPGSRRIMDQACGTGILTFKIARAFPGAEVAGVELRDEYLQFARQKAQADGLTRVTFYLGRAEDVLLEGWVDCITSSYLAKYADLDLLLANAARMLKPGGRVVLHDFTRPENPVYRFLWELYLFLLRTIGGPVFPEWRTVFRELPQFLRQSTWLPDTLSLLEKHGFVDIECSYLTFQTAALVTARKPGAP